MSRFHHRILPAFGAELDAAAREDAAGRAGAAFAHLERAHVLGQASTRLHVQVHWRMLRWALRHRRRGESFGQVLRLAGAALKTPVGALPRGNTGGSNVSALRSMPVAADLQRLIDSARR